MSQEKIKRDYSQYVLYVHHGRWIKARHLALICSEAEKLLNDELVNEEGENVQILIIQCPPQHGKSMVITETLPSYFLGKNPSGRVIEVSYGDDLARKFGRRNKQKIIEFGKDLFGIELSMDNKSDTEFEILGHKGSMISRGIMSGITGQAGDLIIIDDPVKNRQEADSETYRERMWEEWLYSIKTRLSARGKVILIQTRWHEDDLAGRIQMYENRVKTINIPCEAEDDDILGRKRGEALFPEIGKDTAWKNEFKKVYMKQEGTRAWLALFQGRPTAEEGNLVKRYWWNFWKPAGMDLPPVTMKNIDGVFQNYYAQDLPEYWDEMVQSWDCAFKDQERNDYVCGEVWGRRTESYYLLDLVNEHMDLPNTINMVELFTEKWPKALKKLIEGKANGPAVVQILKRKLTGLIEVEPEGGKEARVNAITPAIESGSVFIPHPLVHSWSNEFLNQFSAFPTGKWDDMVDAASQALNVLVYRTRDTKKLEGISGNYFYKELIMRGLKSYEIKKLVRERRVKLLDSNLR